MESKAEKSMTEFYGLVSFRFSKLQVLRMGINKLSMNRSKQ